MTPKGTWIRWPQCRSLSLELRHRLRETSDRAPRRAVCRLGQCPTVPWGPFVTGHRTGVRPGGWQRRAEAGCKWHGGLRRPCWRWRCERARSAGGRHFGRPPACGLSTCLTSPVAVGLLYGAEDLERGPAKNRGGAEADHVWRGGRWGPFRPSRVLRSDWTGPLTASRERERLGGCRAEAPEPRWTKGRAKA
ncbi:hypothetical protein NDU88_007268 [Pleurodeles waltl]|uniref:Uncharacterized protein n=1 Tax=Pleurodeles waltl TaxID=8319 RepID=A0AAV7UQJ5_PLEWA|nr:hypothetical protein NDU88_007268 [Pleurodeles waltl]